MLFGDGHGEAFHDGEEVLPDEPFQSDVLVNLLRGDTVQQVSNSLPEEIRLVVVG